MRVRVGAQVIETFFSAWLGVLLLLLVADASQRMQQGTLRSTAVARLILALVTVIGRMADWSTRPTHEDASEPRDHRIGA